MKTRTYTWLFFFGVVGYLENAYAQTDRKPLEITTRPIVAQAPENPYPKGLPQSGRQSLDVGTPYRMPEEYSPYQALGVKQVGTEWEYLSALQAAQIFLGIAEGASLKRVDIAVNNGAHVSISKALPLFGK